MSRKAAGNKLGGIIFVSFCASVHQGTDLAITIV